MTGGAIHAGDATAAQAHTDLQVAYLDAAGRLPTAPITTEGQTLTSGVYNAVAGIGLNGTVTLDGQGNPNAVFIFQAATTLITGANSAVTLIDGATAANVFWQVGSSATLDFCGGGEAAAYTDRAYIGFGLGTVPSPPGGATRRLFTVSTTDPTIGPVVEHLELSDGTRYDSNGKHHIGFLARIRPSPGLHPDRYWFLCAGLAPRGAAGGGWFLANHWRSLHQWAGANEFVAVLAIRRYSDQISGLERLIVGPPDAESREQPSAGSGE
ncbi:ice-binding family protein [Nocardia salmonicida]|uniref:ice-binding family protein n=1 Tax=Nocardia salmonicida TaxID=53431 RepID=UPI0036C607AA